MKKPVVMLLPERDFDPSEAAIPWLRLTAAGYTLRFATPEGRVAHADPHMLSGRGLDVWSRLPGLQRVVGLGLLLRANRRARQAYRAMQQDQAFQQPMRYADLDADQCAGVLIPGGHWARGMRDFLEDARLQRFVAECFARKRPLAAVCHGVVLVARSTNAQTGRSVLYGRKTTALTWDLERSAWNLMRFAGRIWDPNYYRTYPEQRGEAPGYRSVQAEVSRALADPTDFLDVPTRCEHRFRKSSGLFRDSPNDLRPAWVVCDGHYVSARWPGDLHLFTQRFIEALGADPAID